jgi:hypothetical protein
MVKPMKNIFYFLLSLLVFSIFVTPVMAIDKESDSGAMLLKSNISNDSRVDKLKSYLKAHNSPAVDAAEVFISEADKYNLDWKLVAAISGLESTFCQQIPTGSYNCWGWGIPTGAQSGIGFSSYKDGISRVSEGLRNNYINRGFITIEQIGSIYAASPTWALRVRYFLKDIDAWQGNLTNQIFLPITI